MKRPKTPPENIDKLKELNKQVHDLHYYKPGQVNGPSIKPDRERGKALAKKIRANIEAYQDEIAASSRPGVQAL